MNCRIYLFILIALLTVAVAVVLVVDIVSFVLVEVVYVEEGTKFSANDSFDFSALLLDEESTVLALE